ncbi:MAG: hypothetical protein JXA20_09765 [Spirochaetes bacterium]|nr:hypothetical protein [Spirochaetota bacterium]
MKHALIGIIPPLLAAILAAACLRSDPTGGTVLPVAPQEDREARFHDGADSGTRYYTFLVDRPYRIEFQVDKADVDAAERLLKEIDLEAATGSQGGMFGLHRGDADFNLRYWRAIYNRVYQRSRGTVERLAGIFRRIKSENGLNDQQTMYVIARFVQFMKYDLPPGVGIYSPVRTLYEPGKGTFTEPPGGRGSGWHGAGDCDTKSLLMAMLFQACGYRAVVFDSYRYQHAMTGVDCPGADGVSLEYRGVRYFFVESTYPNWNIGQMPPQYNDLTFFHPIDPREDQRGLMSVSEGQAPDGGPPVTGQGPSEREPNNDMASADVIPSVVIGGALDENDTTDWYRLTGQESTFATFTLVHGSGDDFGMEIYNDGTLVSSAGSSRSLSASLPGQCHVRVYRTGGGGRYMLFVTPGGPGEKEPNDSREAASSTSTMTILGELADTGDVDWYALAGQEGYNATYTVYSAAGANLSIEVFNDGRSVGRARGGVTAEHPGRVEVCVRSEGGGSGWYLITIERNR